MDFDNESRKRLFCWLPLNRFCQCASPPSPGPSCTTGTMSTARLLCPDNGASRHPHGGERTHELLVALICGFGNVSPGLALILCAPAHPCSCVHSHLGGLFGRVDSSTHRLLKPSGVGTIAGQHQSDCSVILSKWDTHSVQMPRDECLSEEMHR